MLETKNELLYAQLLSQLLSEAILGGCIILLWLNLVGVLLPSLVYGAVVLILIFQLMVGLFFCSLPTGTAARAKQTGTRDGEGGQVPITNLLCSG